MRPAERWREFCFFSWSAKALCFFIFISFMKTSCFPAQAKKLVMKKKYKTVLTKNSPAATLRRMAIDTPTATRQKRSNSKPLKPKTPTVQERYSRFFVPTTSPLWQDDGNYSLEQPSPLVWVPTVTTYGIDSSLCPVTNAELE